MLPSVDGLLQTRTAVELISDFGRPLTIQAFREALDDIREKLSDQEAIPSNEKILASAEKKLAFWCQPGLQSVINATGVILHTNLGRAPLSKEAIKNASIILGDYNNLEYDLKNGKRGKRWEHSESVLCRLTGAESALVVNNNAGALLLALAALTRRKHVIIARSQLIEIGGGFRIPDVMRQSGAKLVEVGTTNRVHLMDYVSALNGTVGGILFAHHSNFEIIGFTTEPDIASLCQLGESYNVPVICDLGSGALLDTSKYGLKHEMMVQEVVQSGADIITFSGDKLIGGPQAGIILGKKVFLDKIKKQPLARALRPDKTCLALLETTLGHYLKNEAEQKIPVWQMISRPKQQLKTRAEHWQSVLKAGDVIEAKSTVGGGSLPGETLDTYVFALKMKHPDQFVRRLRHQQPPIIARIEKDLAIFDPRTVSSEQEGALLVGIQNAMIN
jgi:L-seryl-tRNA(Ser) seleniumtransferase